MITFNNTKWQLSSRGDNHHGPDDSGAFYAKINLEHNSRKSNTLYEEYKILFDLYEKQCQTSVKPVYYGTIKDFMLAYPNNDNAFSTLNHASNILVMEKVKNVGYCVKPVDIIFAIIEQQKLGIFHNDIKPSNMGWDEVRAVPVFFDYDQAVILQEEEKITNSRNFLEICNKIDKAFFGIGCWHRHIGDVNVNEYFEDNTFLMSKTAVFQEQVTTNTFNGIYHSLAHSDVKIDGSRTNFERERVLNTFDFGIKEKVLDIGCNMGLLSYYLAGRGCDVTGIDNDKKIVTAAQLVANVIGVNNIKFKHCDFDYVEPEKFEKYDTIFLFSVLHHMRNVERAAKIISDSCSRIIIESRPNEHGKQPIKKGSWYDTSGWNFVSYRDLMNYFEKLFNFHVKRIETVDKGRSIIELIK